MFFAKRRFLRQMKAIHSNGFSPFDEKLGSAGAHVRDGLLRPDLSPQILAREQSQHLNTFLKGWRVFGKVIFWGRAKE
jgi:hypothetical protein